MYVCRAPYLILLKGLAKRLCEYSFSAVQCEKRRIEICFVHHCSVLRYLFVVSMADPAEALEHENFNPDEQRRSVGR